MKKYITTRDINIVTKRGKANFKKGQVVTSEEILKYFNAFEIKCTDKKYFFEEVAAEETKVEETKVEETKVEETKVEETPAEETKVEETPAEDFIKIIFQAKKDITVNKEKVVKKGDKFSYNELKELLGEEKLESSLSGGAFIEVKVSK